LLEGVAVSPGVLVGLSWVSIVAGRCGGLARRTSFAGRACFALALPVGAPSFLHAVPTAQGGGRSCRLPTFCPYGALAVVGLPGGEHCRSVWRPRPAHFFRRACLFRTSVAGRCAIVFTCCTYGTGRRAVL